MYAFKQTINKPKLIISGNCLPYVKLKPKPSSLLISHLNTKSCYQVS